MVKYILLFLDNTTSVCPGSRENPCGSIRRLKLCHCPFSGLVLYVELLEILIF